MKTGKMSRQVEFSFSFSVVVRNRLSCDHFYQLPYGITASHCSLITHSVEVRCFIRPTLFRSRTVFLVVESPYQIQHNRERSVVLDLVRKFNQKGTVHELNKVGLLLYLSLILCVMNEQCKVFVNLLETYMVSIQLIQHGVTTFTA